MTSIRKSHDYNRICLSFAGGYYPPSLSVHNGYVSIIRVCWPLWWLAINVSILWAKDSCVPVESQSLTKQVQEVFFFLCLLCCHFKAVIESHKIFLVKECHFDKHLSDFIVSWFGGCFLPYKYHCGPSLFLYSSVSLTQFLFMFDHIWKSWTFFICSYMMINFLYQLE